MSFVETALLGAFAGFTIYLGLPAARLRLLSDRARVCLAMFAVGVLAFLFVDVFSEAFEHIHEAIIGIKAGREETSSLIGLGAVLAIGFLLGSAGLGFLERRMRRQKPLPATGGTNELAPESTVNDIDAEARRLALQTGMTIAAAIGMHNFSEGLAIGVSARTGAIGLATVLIIGFALHNATEGFGIVGPLSGVRVSWRWIALAGLVGGGPTFLGTIVGYHVKSELLEVAFYALAGGAIFYVIGEISQGMRRYGHRELGLLMVGSGFLLGVATNLVVLYGGGVS
jgi:zinc transporter, ZIP family